MHAEPLGLRGAQVGNLWPRVFGVSAYCSQKLQEDSKEKKKKKNKKKEQDSMNVQFQGPITSMLFALKEYRMSLLSCPRTQQLCRLQSLHLPRHPLTAVELRDTIKGTPFIHP